MSRTRCGASAAERGGRRSASRGWREGPSRSSGRSGETGGSDLCPIRSPRTGLRSLPISMWGTRKAGMPSRWRAAIAERNCLVAYRQAGRVQAPASIHRDRESLLSRRRSGGTRRRSRPCCVKRRVSALTRSAGPSAARGGARGTAPSAPGSGPGSPCAPANGPRCLPPCTRRARFARATRARSCPTRCEATHRPVVSMSLNASRRWGPLSASSKARLNPVEPRTLGSTHAYPCERKKAVVADQRIRELFAGPPWYETITGSLPERFFGNRMFMGRPRPSCAFASVTLTSISGNSFSDGRASLRNRVALPVFASMAQGSYGEDGVDQRATKRFPSSENSERKPCPSGIATFERGRSGLWDRLDDDAFHHLAHQPLTRQRQRPVGLRVVGLDLVAQVPVREQPDALGEKPPTVRREDVMHPDVVPGDVRLGVRGRLRHRLPRRAARPQRKSARQPRLGPLLARPARALRHHFS